MCPSCGNKSRVLWVSDKRYFCARKRKCLNKQCGKVFNTSENVSQGIDYRGLIKEIKKLVKDVK